MATVKSAGANQEFATIARVGNISTTVTSYY